MSFININIDDYGQVLRVTLTQDDVAFDASSYDTVQYIFKPPRGDVQTKTAAFQSDGSDGVCEYTVLDGLFDIAGIWTLWVVISKTGVKITSVDKTFEVAHTYE